MIFKLINFFEFCQIYNDVFDFYIFVNIFKIDYDSLNIFFIPPDQNQVEAKFCKNLCKCSSNSISKSCDAYIAITIFLFEVDRIKSFVVNYVRRNPVKWLYCFSNKIEWFKCESSYTKQKQYFLKLSILLIKKKRLDMICETRNQTHFLNYLIKEKGHWIIVNKDWFQHKFCSI